MRRRSYSCLAMGAFLLAGACSEADSPPSGGDAPSWVTPSEAVAGSPAVDSSGAPLAPAGSGQTLAGDSAGQTASAMADAPTSGGQPTPGGSAGPPPTVDLPPPIPSSEANAILTRAERAYSQIRSMEADFTQEVYVPLLESTQNSRGRLFHRSPDRFLMRFSDPEGDVIVADGRYVWMYYPSTDDGQVVRTALSSTGQQMDLYREFLADATSRFEASLDGSEAVGGRPAKILTLIPRQASPYRRVRIWVDDQDSLVRRFEISEENGSVRMLQLSGLRLNGTLSDELFRFTPPPGVQVHDF